MYRKYTPVASLSRRLDKNPIAASNIIFRTGIFVCVATQFAILMYRKYTPVASLSRRLDKNPIAASNIIFRTGIFVCVAAQFAILMCENTLRLLHYHGT